MIRNNKNITRRIIAQAVIFVLLSVAMLAVLHITYKKTTQNYEKEVELAQLENKVLQSYALYNKFIRKLGHSDSYSEEEAILYSDEFSHTLESIIAKVDSERKFVLMSDQSGFEDSKNDLSKNLELYEKSFQHIFLSVKKIGSKNSGSLNSIIQNSNEIYNFLANSNDSSILVYAAKLKELETEFLFGLGENAYVGLQHILEEISYSDFIDAIADSMNTKESFFATINNYQSLIKQHKTTLDRIGSLSHGGLMAQLEENYAAAKNSFEQYHISLLKKIDQSNRRIISLAILLISILILVYIIYLIDLLNTIKKPLTRLISHTEKMATGNIPKSDLKNSDNYEFSIINTNINRIKKGILNKRVFVDNLLKRKFDANVELMGKKDGFGKTLLALRENMRKSREEQIKHSKENDLRRYLNEGIAKFSEILRIHNNELKKLSDVFIKELVRYVNALQGGVFICDEENPDILYLTAAFAYNRKKFMQKSFQKGEGLVGACAIEKKLINITEVPQAYIEITSGLGDSPPRNILLVPIVHEDNLIGVLEMASLSIYSPQQLELVETVATNLASAIISTRSSTRTQQLLQKSQKQAAEMSEQEEEMRQNMEELQATQEESARREEELEGILNALNQAFYVIEYDIEGVICNVNKKLLFLLNKESREVIDKKHQDIFGKQSTVDEAFFANIAEGNMVELSEEIIVNKKSLQIHNTFSPIKSKEGETIRILNIISMKL